MNQQPQAESEDKTQGVKIERLPTMGKPLSLKGSRYRPSGYDQKVSSEKYSKLKKIEKILSEENPKS